MDKGIIVAEGSPVNLIKGHSSREVVELRFAVGAQEAAVPQLTDIADRIEELPDRVLLYTQDGDRTMALVHERGLQPEAVVVRRSTLEDVFLRLTGRTLVD
jgi:lipooligosaccharide transport system ATP-binding protein